MSLKKMLALLVGGLVVVVILGVYALVIEPARPTTEEAAKERQLVFRYKDEQNRTLRDVATKLEVRRKGKTVVLEKVSPQVWRMRKPLDARADRSKILGILDTLKDLKTQALVKLQSTKPEELEKFGLKTPRVEATFWLANGQSHSFAIGAERKGQKTWEKRTYLRVGESAELRVVDNDIAEKLDKDPDEFREGPRTEERQAHLATSQARPGPRRQLQGRRPPDQGAKPRGRKIHRRQEGQTRRIRPRQATVGLRRHRPRRKADETPRRGQSQGR